jgi:hypothetical protein
MSNTSERAIARILVANPSAESLTLAKWPIPKQSWQLVVCAVVLFALGFQGCGGGPGGSITPPPPPPPAGGTSLTGP